MRARTIMLWLAAVVFISGMVLAIMWRWDGVAPTPETDLQPTEAQPGIDSEPRVLQNVQTKPARAGPIVPETEPGTTGGATGTIDTPEENEAVPRTFHVTGHCGSVPAGSHLILVVQ